MENQTWNGNSQTFMVIFFSFLFSLFCVVHVISSHLHFSKILYMFPCSFAEFTLSTLLPFFKRTTQYLEIRFNEYKLLVLV